VRSNADAPPGRSQLIGPGLKGHYKERLAAPSDAPVREVITRGKGTMLGFIQLRRTCYNRVTFRCAATAEPLFQNFSVQIHSAERVGLGEFGVGQDNLRKAAAPACSCRSQFPPVRRHHAPARRTHLPQAPRPLIRRVRDLVL
jgi:hypothetical protein